MPAPQILHEPSHIQTIAHAFDLGDVTCSQETSKVYRIDAQAGTFALRFFNSEATQRHVQATQSVRWILAATGLPIGAPIRTPTGVSLFACNGLFCELQPWMFHTDTGDHWSRLITASAALRQIHDGLVTADVHPDPRDDPWRTPAMLAEQLGSDAANLRDQARQRGVVIDHHLDRAAAILDTLRVDGSLDACARQLTHGDFQGPNLLFHGSDLCGIIDFERLAYRPRLYDLAWPFVFWRWFGTNQGSYTDADWHQARACCEGYTAAAPTLLEKDEWRTLPLLMAYIPARGIAQAASEDAPIEEIQAFAVALDFAEWLVKHPGDALARLRR